MRKKIINFWAALIQSKEQIMLKDAHSAKLTADYRDTLRKAIKRKNSGQHLLTLPITSPYCQILDLDPHINT